MSRKIFIVLCLFASHLVSGQSVLDKTLDPSAKGKKLSELLHDIAKKDTARFFFRPEWIESFSFDQNAPPTTLRTALDNFFDGTDLSYFAMYPDVVVIVKDERQTEQWKSAISTAVQQGRKIEPLTIGSSDNPKKGSVTISGIVTDAKTQAPLPNVNIQLDSENGTATDEQGKFVFPVNSGPHVLNFTFVEYETKVIDLRAYQDGEIRVEMEEAAVLLSEVIIRDESAREISTSRIGQTQLSMQEIKRSPALLGVPDLIKQVQSLPGVTTVGEAATGFNVRGGSVDQNLILYDGMPAYNSSHVFGFLSAYNADAIRDVNFYKGGIPAEYGGRVSSVLDIQSKDGNLKKWSGGAGIGMLTANVMVNGPLKKDRSAIAATFRSTYSDWLVHAIKTDYADLSNSSVFFYDGTIKYTNLFNDKTRLSVTGYSSRDAFRLVGDSTYQWSNLQISARIDHQFSQSLSADFGVGVSRYGYNVENDNVRTASELSYNITSTILKAGFNYQRTAHKLSFGWQFQHYTFDPGTLKPTSAESNARNISMEDQYAIENALYFSDSWSYQDRWFIEGGLRLPIFSSLGPGKRYGYDPDLPRDITSITDTLYYGTAENIKTYIGLEPRLSLRRMLSPTSSLKLGYNRMYQFLHLVTNTTAVTPVDIWQPSGYYFKPQSSDQISLGYFRDLAEKKYNLSLELFYKTIKNVLDFKDGAQLIMNDHIETDLLQGKAKAYGVETSFSKNIGRLTASLNYTYSRSFRLIAGPTSSESINEGKQYPSNFDQPHIANLSWKYNLTSRHFFTGNFTYHSGRPVTVPISIIALENTTVAYFSGRNQYRIPDYHRLDVAFIIEGTNKRHRKWVGTWVFSVYNVYGRNNPYTVFFKSSGNGVPKPYQLSIIGTILPSVSYTVKFH